MTGNKDIARFKRDVKAFGMSAAGHLPHGIGQAIGIHDTYQKGRQLAKSAPKAARTYIRKATGITQKRRLK